MRQTQIELQGEIDDSLVIAGRNFNIPIRNTAHWIQQAENQ